MSLPGWWDRKGQKQNARSREQERRHAKATGGKVQAGSGSSWRAKEDVRAPNYLDQLKYTDSASYTLKASEVRTITEHALADGREGRLIISFEKHDLVVVIQKYEGE